MKPLFIIVYIIARVWSTSENHQRKHSPRIFRSKSNADEREKRAQHRILQYIGGLTVWSYILHICDAQNIVKILEFWKLSTILDSIFPKHCRKCHRMSPISVHLSSGHSRPGGDSRICWTTKSTTALDWTLGNKKHEDKSRDIKWHQKNINMWGL